VAEANLILGDCVEAMRQMDAASVDLVLTSPPYDNLRKYAAGSSFDFEATAAEIVRLLKPGGVCVWVVGDETKDGSESGTSFRQALHFKAIGLKLRDTMIWRKSNPFPGGDTKRTYVGAFEFMFVFTKGRPATINQLREPCKRAGKPQFCLGRESGRLTRKSYSGKLTGATKPRSNVWEYGLGNGRFPGHPATFPLQLAVDHILSWTDPGDVVLDPFVGSGTVLEACIRTGRHGIGIEKAEPYRDIARARIDAALASPAVA
jgi:DNA modification methylase